MIAQSEYSVFLVDDDKMFLTSLKNNLQQQFGPMLKVSEYNTGEKCIEDIFHFYKPLDEAPDIIILDYQLTDEMHPEAINGINVLIELKSISKDIIVIMLSGQDKLQVATDSIKNGAYEYITKSETALFNTQKALKSAMKTIRSLRENDKYLKWNGYMGLAIISVILLDIIWSCAMH